MPLLLPLSVLLVACAQGSTIGPGPDAGPDPFDQDAEAPADRAAPLDGPAVPKDTGPAPLDTGPADNGPAPLDNGPTDTGPAPLDAGPAPVDVPMPPADTGTRCGGLNEPCCGTACAGSAVCLSGRCVACGSEGERCCAGGACAGGTACDGALCRACGRVGALCCPGELCTAGSVCANGRCDADADRDGVPASLDCDDNDPQRSPNVAERCNGRDDNCNQIADEGDTCGLWFLPRGATAWQAFARDVGREQVPPRPSPHAPALPVRAAVDIESLGLAYVLTDTTFHLLDLGTRAWVDSGPRTQLLPESAGASLVTAYTVPAHHGDPTGMNEGVVLHFRDRVLHYQFALASRAMRFTRRDPIAPWTGTHAPSLDRVRLCWLDLQNSEGWITQNPASFCPPGTTTDTRVGPYFAMITDTAVHTADAGYCFQWIATVPHSTFPPFRLPGAPAPAALGATWHRGGVWALRAQ